MFDVSLLHSPGVPSGDLRDHMVTLLSSIFVPAPPPQAPTPVFQPNRRGLSYGCHGYGQPWNYSNAAPSASPPADCVGWAAATVDLNDKAMSPTDAVDVDTVEELEELLNEAVENPVNDGVFNKLAFMPQQHIELVVGEDEAEEAEEAGRPRRDFSCIDPHQAIADAVFDTLYDGLTWDAVQGERPKIVLPSTKFSYEKFGKPCCSCRMRSMYMECGAIVPFSVL